MSQIAGQVKIKGEMTEKSSNKKSDFNIDEFKSEKLERTGASVANLQKSKKLLRLLSDLSNRIDESTGKCSKVEELFSPVLVSLRSKLRDCSGAAIKSDEYISGALDISWRKASYEVLHVAKR